MTKTPHPSSETKTSQPLELVHFDLTGPIKPMSFHSKKRYVLVIIDDYTHYVWAYGLRLKSEATDLIQNWVALVQNQFDAKVKKFRSDRGGEFLNSELQQFCADHGIKHELTADKSPEQNGKAERMHQTLFNKARCMLLRSGLPPSFWLHALSYAVWVQNRIPTTAVTGIPYSLLTGKAPNLAMAKVFGCLAHIFVHSDNRVNNKKLSPHSEWGIFLGVREETKGWEFYLPLSGKIGFVTRNVKSLEEKFLKQWRLDMTNSGQAFDPSSVVEPHEYSGEFLEFESEVDVEDDAGSEDFGPSGPWESPLSLPPDYLPVPGVAEPGFGPPQPDLEGTPVEVPLLPAPPELGISDHTPDILPGRSRLCPTRGHRL